MKRSMRKAHRDTQLVQRAHLSGMRHMDISFLRFGISCIPITINGTRPIPTHIPPIYCHHRQHHHHHHYHHLAKEISEFEFGNTSERAGRLIY